MPSEKSRLVSFFLTLLLGPLGLFYASVGGALVMIVLAVITVPVTGGASAIIIWILSIAIGDHVAYKKNKSREELLNAIRGRDQ